MIVGDLFSGIGGFSLAAHWMGWRTAWFSEIDPFACAVLTHHWPDIPNYGDIRDIDFTTVPRVDLLCGGFPCQDISNAGKRAGITGARSSLWKEYARAIRTLRPRYVVVENVAALRSRGLDVVLGDLADAGYDAEWRVLSAADVGAYHQRKRFWITATLADDDGARLQGGERCGTASVTRPSDRHAGERCIGVGHRDREREQQLQGRDEEGGRRVGDSGAQLVNPSSGGRRTGPGLDVRRADGGCASVGDTDDTRPQGHGRSVAIDDAEGRNTARRHSAAASRLVDWSNAVAVRGADGTVRAIPFDAATRGPQSALWPVAYGVPGRVAQLRGIGNSIVPQCALQIFRAIETRDAMKEAA